MSSEMTRASFEHLGLMPKITNVLQALGYESPTPIQEKTIPVILKGGDLLGQAQTGTGKTAAFALPLLNNIDIDSRAPQVLVLAPTRELAIQVSEAFQTYARSLKGFHVLPIYGGQSMSNQLHALKRGAHVVVGTPGRIMDHLRRKSLKLDGLKTLVLDEADEMLKMGFIDDIEWILEHTPTEKQVALFSATMPPAIKKVAQKYLRNEEHIKIESKTSTVETINQRYWLVSGVHKLDALTRILEAEDSGATLIFARTKNSTIKLAEKLEARGHACAAMNGDLSQALRERTIERLKKGQIDIVIATDVAARGLDVDRIRHVINYDIPYDTESYVHRIGRTGRAGREGMATLFVSPRERGMLKAIERATRQPIKEFDLPNKEDITKTRVERFKKRLAKVMTKQDLGFYAGIVEEFMSENDVPFEEVAAALTFLAQKNTPLIVRDLPKVEIRESSRGRERRGSDRRSRRDRDSRRGRDRDRGRDRGRARGRDRNQERDRDLGMVSCRIEVGRRHGVSPGSIVAAIAEGAGIDGKHIGRIQLHNHYSTVDLPEKMRKKVLSDLSGAKVSRRPMKISEL